MKTHYAYQLTDSNYSLGVDTDPGKLWGRFAGDLKAAAASGGVERIEVGMVQGDTTAEALDAVRAEEWVDGTYAVGLGRGPE